MRNQLVIIMLTLMSDVTARRVENIFAIGDSSTTSSQSEPDNQDFELSIHGSNNSTSHPGCARDREMLLALEDFRRELQDVNLQYLEHASVDRACGNSDGGESTRDASNRNCHLDFAHFSSNLHKVCEKHGGVYEEREHSIQCHSSQQNLYYQYDRFPNCFPASCERNEIDSLVAKQMETVRHALEEDSGMTCYADFDILRHAGEEELEVSAAAITSHPTNAATFLGLVLIGINIVCCLG